MSIDNIPSGSGRVTLAHVAAAAGVSPSSVANVLRGHPHVRAEVRARVQLAVQELGYRPLAIGQNLRSGRTGAVSLAVPSIASPYFAEVASAAVEVGAGYGLRVVVQQTDNRLERERELGDAWNLGAADGLIFSPSVVDDAELERRRGRMPLVLLGEHSALTTVDRIGIDSPGASRLVVEHLIERGARRIAMIGHKSTGDPRVVQEREQGYLDALAAHGLDPVCPIVAVDLWERPDGAAAVGALLDSGVPFDAVFCANDLLAIGVLRRLLEEGVDVPGRVRVAGIDDIAESAFAGPGLTTVAIDRRWMVEKAFEFICRRLETADVPAEQVVVPHRLVVRGTT